MARTTGNRRNGTICGHPHGLVVLAGTELWDRISFSGMQAILVLCVVEHLFAPRDGGQGSPCNRRGAARAPPNDALDVIPEVRA